MSARRHFFDRKVWHGAFTASVPKAKKAIWQNLETIFTFSNSHSGQPAGVTTTLLK